MIQPQHKLALGDSKALVHRTEVEFLDFLQSSGRPYSDASFTERSNPVSKGYTVRLGGIILAASAGTGLRVSSRASSEFSIAVPIGGDGKLLQARKSHSIRSNGQIIRANYLTPLTFHSSSYSHVNIKPERSGLIAELAVLCPRFKDVDLALEVVGTTVTDGSISGIDYYRILRNLISVVDRAGCDGRYLERIGLETILSRLLAEIVLAQFGRTVSGNTSSLLTGVSSIDVICDHIKSNIGKPLTMPQMERLSGLSSDGLTYAFRSRFNCSPQEWQRNFLLDEARRLLKAGRTSVPSVAKVLGFLSSSTFVFHYRRRFGEVPHSSVDSGGGVGVEVRSGDAEQ